MSEHPSPVEPVPQTPSDSQTTGVLSFVLQAACGVTLLLSAFFLIAVAPYGSFLAMLIIFRFTPGLNVMWFGVCIALSIYGTRRRMPGITWSPIIFFSLWFSAAVMQRAILATHADAGAAQTAEKVALPTDLRETTLTLLGQGDLTRDYWYYKPLVERKVARIVTGRVFDLSSASPRAESITYAEGETCRNAGYKLDRLGTKFLIQAGRLDECFLSYGIKGIPDSLVVQIRDLSDRPPAIDIIVRENGKDRTLVTRAQRRTFVLNYLPMIASGRSFTFATERSDATDQVGTEDLTTAHRVIVALFGEDAFTPIPPKPDPRSPEILALASQMLNQQQIKAALNLVTLAKDAGNVTSVIDDVMAANACDDGGENDQSYQKYLRSRTPDQSLILLRKVFARASDPRHAKDHTGCYGLLPSPGSHQLEFEAAARDLFRQKGLGVWQYEFALVFLKCAVREPTQNCHPPKREDIAGIAFTEDDPATFVNRVIAFEDQYPKLTDDEIRGLARRLSIIADDDLDRFEKALGVAYLIETKAGTAPSDIIVQLRQAAKDRAKAIRDRQVRGRFSSWVNPREAR